MLLVNKVPFKLSLGGTSCGRWNTAHGGHPWLVSPTGDNLMLLVKNVAVTGEQVSLPPLVLFPA